jgi:ABC-type dipeptide/oligopeptide/nickel transport system permease component
VTIYVVRRLLQVIPALVGIAVIAFCVIQLAPGDAALYIAGDGAPAEVLERVRAEFGLDRSLPVQLGSYVANMLRGDLGFSYKFGEPVSTVLLERAPYSLLLVGAALIVGTLAGVALGCVAAVRSDTLLDRSISILALGGYSAPVFWLGQLLILAFSVYLGLLPTQGMRSLREELSGLAGILDVARHMVLPVLTLSMWHMAVVVRMTRSSLLSVLGQDFVRTARAKGVSEYVVLTRHALRNALIPVVTVVSVNAGFLLSGAVLTETVFAWPGLGRLVLSATLSRDLPLLMGVFVSVSFAVLILNLVTDLLYGVLDPRIEYR